MEIAVSEHELHTLHKIYWTAIISLVIFCIRIPIFEFYYFAYYHWIVCMSNKEVWIIRCTLHMTTFHFMRKRNRIRVIWSPNSGSQHVSHETADRLQRSFILSTKYPLSERIEMCHFWRINLLSYSKYSRTVLVSDYINQFNIRLNDFEHTFEHDMSGIMVSKKKLSFFLFSHIWIIAVIWRK